MPASDASTFTVLPAIDLRGGHVVRLRQGDFAREAVYGDDPVGVACGFAAAGARWIHVVDLDGARAGERRQAAVVARIVPALESRVQDGANGRETPRVQVAGGIRTAAAVADALAGGASRVVLGTAALADPEFAAAAVRRHGSRRIAVALDVRDDHAVGDGWVEGGPAVPMADALAAITAAGVTTIIVTAIERDGLLGGPDLALLERCVRSTTSAVVASGGIRSVADLEAVRRIGCAGAIVGRAIYDGRLDFAAALAALDTAPD